MVFRFGNPSKLINMKAMIMSQMKMLELKNMVRGENNVLISSSRRLKTTKEIITELEDRSTEIYANLDSRRAKEN